MTQGVYRDADAIQHLQAAIGEEDPEASSHWRAMHAGFSFTDGALQGLRGFGNFSPRSRRVEAIAHRAFQTQWRRMGARFPAFERIDRIADEVTRRHDRIYDLDVLRQSLTLAYLEAKLGARLRAAEAVTVIGDGYGTLTSLVLEAFPRTRVILVNLAKTLLVDLLFIRRAFPSLNTALVTNAQGMADALADTHIRLIAVKAQDQSLLSGTPSSVAMNIASMQEMNPETIARYFFALRALSRQVAFYCCNREEKTLPDGTVVRFASYPWRAEDIILDDGLCPWHQRYYSARPPFVRAYDGPMRHRLAVLAPGAS